MAAKPLIRVPDKAKVGEIIEIKTLVAHVMETGQRRDKDGKLIPRNIIHTFEAKFAGKTVFTAKLFSGIASNPYLAFFMKVPGPGELEFTWADDGGEKISEKMKLSVA
jgi:sulfur-oxidizing protein SoxZ